MKIKIIKNGGYVFGGSLRLPVTVKADALGKHAYMVTGSELIEQGASPNSIKRSTHYCFEDRDVEVVHCKAIRQGDQMHCVCGLAWDVDEEYTPQCQN